MIVGMDIDGVNYNWTASVREWMRVSGTGDPAEFDDFIKHAGPVPGNSVFDGVVVPGTHAGVVCRFGGTYPDAPEAWQRIAAAGHEIAVITARGTTPVIADAEQEATEWWLAEHNMPYASITYATDKAAAAAALGVHVMLEDSATQYHSITAAGVPTWLRTQPWNEHVDTVRRVPTVSRFADLVISGEAAA